MMLRRFDGGIIDPDTYSRAQLLKDLRTIDHLRPVVDQLDRLTFPGLEEGKAYAKRMTNRMRKVEA